ncbi:MAG: anthranilate phosphoribosyltransferase [Planctomycetota bacterium]|nr:anthranilate phosphoribosyltransferase [Planctomycetota bacterium]
MFLEWIGQAESGKDLTAIEMEGAITEMLAGRADAMLTARLLLALRAKGESVSELIGAALAMRRAMTPIKTSRTNLLDTCGTGGDGAKTFNISTAAAIIAAAAGATVAKHGNRKITSATGSADVLAELGIKIDASREIVERCIEEVGIGFCYAPLLHPAMKHVSEVRRSLGVPTLFNYLGPLCNPAGASYQVLGVGRADLQEKIASALLQLPIHAAIVVRGEDGLDEVTLSSNTQVLHIQNGSIERLQWNPGSFGKSPIAIESLCVESPSESAEVIREILAGKLGPARDIVVCNAAAGLWLAGIEQNLLAAVERCEKAIDRGDAAKTLTQLAALSSSGS